MTVTITWNFMDLYDKNKYVRGLYHWIWYLGFNKRIIFWAGLGGAKIWLIQVTYTMTMTWYSSSTCTYYVWYEITCSIATDEHGSLWWWNIFVRGLYHWIWYLEFNKRIIFWAGLGRAKIQLVEVTYMVIMTWYSITYLLWYEITWISMIKIYLLEVYITEFDILNSIKEQFSGLALVGQRYDLLRSYTYIYCDYDLVK